jgi:cytochrome c biogenesis protein CcmG/thiol:disulfide interchange protein DsbE
MRWKFAAGAAALAIPAVGLLGFGLTRDPRAIPSPLPGRLAPTFALAAFTSGSPTPQHPDPIPQVDSIRLSSLRGDVVVLNFYASWCLACRDEHPALQRVASRYVGTDVHFIGILYNDISRAALNWLSEMGPLPYPSLDDPGSHAAIDYGLYGVPETFFIARDGRVALKHVGPVSDQLLTTEIESLRAAQRSDAAGAKGGSP